MSYEAWVIVGLIVNAVMGAVAIYQRQHTIRALNADKFPKVHQPRSWTVGGELPNVSQKADRQEPTDDRDLEAFFKGCGPGTRK
jgi:hypothetical protein